jgi:hypothetical protein
VPELYGVIRSYHDIRNLSRMIADHKDFVVKPARAPAATASWWSPGVQPLQAGPTGSSMAR